MSAPTPTREHTGPATGKTQKRGCLFYVKRGLLALVIVLVALPITGFVYEKFMALGDAERFPPFGQMVDVDGHRLHIYCQGEGSPTVILEGGGVAALSCY